MKNEPKLGKLCNSESVKKDAVHIAIHKVVAERTLKPGQHVGIVSTNVINNETVYVVGPSSKPIGVVDSYLKKNIEHGQLFYLMLYPGSITSLQHHWTHPDFIEQQENGMSVDKQKAKLYIQKEADRLLVNYDELMYHAQDYIDHGNYWSEGGRFESEYINEEFWDYYKVLTGKEPKYRESFFSCSC